jgi:hypothetical protein
MAGNPSLQIPPPIMNCLQYISHVTEQDPIFNPSQESTRNVRVFRTTPSLLTWWELDDARVLAGFQYSLQEFEVALEEFSDQVGLRFHNID